MRFDGAARKRYEQWQENAKPWPLPKHNGARLQYIFDNDRQYLVWCLHQDWFRVKFPSWFDIIVRMFHRIGETWDQHRGRGL